MALSMTMSHCSAVLTLRVRPDTVPRAMQRLAFKCLILDLDPHALCCAGNDVVCRV